jgi:ribonuclease P protein component
MLKRKHRLAKSKEISRVYARGRGFFSPLFTVKVFYEKLEAPKFAVVVSTKVSKRSTARNRLRRIVREYIRLHMDIFRPGNYIVTIKPQAAKLEGPELKNKFSDFIQNNFVTKR